MRTLLFVALGLSAAANAFPVVNYDVTQWATDYVWGGNKIQLGIGWSRDGTVAAGAKVEAGGSIPVAAAISSNINNNFLKNFDYEVGVGVVSSGSTAVDGNVVVAGDDQGKLKYTIGASLPGSRQTLSGSIVGDRAEVKTIGVSVGDSVDTLSASVELDKYEPQSASVDFSSSRIV
ncbi:Hypothetical protein NTJ_02153 [Nesidiocoris tenuis]|uniref:DOMON domain-containing protein n=1 Tax=Nesidiocoris tenuis TaxID=355587 RepID=A0ABN7AAK0_9HEMI|nr:Hypothetical protein NTJ_02153 [Nesidiocoris tenuis]